MPLWSVADVHLCVLSPLAVKRGDARRKENVLSVTLEPLFRVVSLGADEHDMAASYAPGVEPYILILGHAPRHPVVLGR